MIAANFTAEVDNQPNSTTSKPKVTFFNLLGVLPTFCIGILNPILLKELNIFYLPFSKPTIFQLPVEAYDPATLLRRLDMGIAGYI